MGENDHRIIKYKVATLANVEDLQGSCSYCITTVLSHIEMFEMLIHTILSTGIKVYAITRTSSKKGI